MLPLGDLNVSSIDELLPKLPHEFTVDRFSRNGELCTVKISLVENACRDIHIKASAECRPDAIFDQHTHTY